MISYYLTLPQFIYSKVLYCTYITYIHSWLLAGFQVEMMWGNYSTSTSTLQRWLCRLTLSGGQVGSDRRVTCVRSASRAEPSHMPQYVLCRVALQGTFSMQSVYTVSRSQLHAHVHYSTQYRACKELLMNNKMLGTSSHNILPVSWMDF